LEGVKAVEQILTSGFQEDNLEFQADPTNLTQGQSVRMYPIDPGSNYQDSGRLVGLSTTEAVISTLSEKDGKEVRIHYPRWNFAIERANAAKASMDGVKNGVLPLD